MPARLHLRRVAKDRIRERFGRVRVLRLAHAVLALAERAARAVFDLGLDRPPTSGVTLKWPSTIPSAVGHILNERAGCWRFDASA